MHTLQFKICWVGNGKLGNVLGKDKIQILERTLWHYYRGWSLRIKNEKQGGQLEAN